MVSLSSPRQLLKSEHKYHGLARLIVAINYRLILFVDHIEFSCYRITLYAWEVRKGFTIWFTGLSGSGKTTLNHAVSEQLANRGLEVESLDGDAVRKSLSRDLGFSKAERDENIRRIGYVAGLLTRHGVIVLVSAISPYRAVRDEMRSAIGAFVEVYVNAPVETCELRDVKGLYRKARSGELTGFTGIDDPYEPPLDAEVECRTDRESVEESVKKIMLYLEGILFGTGSKRDTEL